MSGTILLCMAAVLVLVGSWVALWPDSADEPDRRPRVALEEWLARYAPRAYPNEADRLARACGILAELLGIAPTQILPTDRFDDYPAKDLAGALLEKFDEAGLKFDPTARTFGDLLRSVASGFETPEFSDLRALMIDCLGIHPSEAGFRPSENVRAFLLGVADQDYGLEKFLTHLSDRLNMPRAVWRSGADPEQSAKKKTAALTFEDLAETIAAHRLLNEERPSSGWLV